MAFTNPGPIHRDDVETMAALQEVADEGFRLRGKGRAPRIYHMAKASGFAHEGYAFTDRGVVKLLVRYRVESLAPKRAGCWEKRRKTDRSILELLAHELAHFTQPHGSRPHGPEFKAEDAVWRATLGYKVCPGWKLPKPKSVPDRIRRWVKLDREQRREEAAAERAAIARTRERKAVVRERVAAKRKAEEHGYTLRKVAEWQRKLRLAQTKLRSWKSRERAAYRRREKEGGAA